MGEAQPSFRSGAVRPVECVRGGWELIRGNYWLFVGVTLVGTLLAYFAPMGILLGPMMCGIYYCFNRKQAGQPVKFEMLFKGFDYFIPSLIATLIMMIPGFVIAIPAFIVMFILYVNALRTTPPGAPPTPGSFTNVLVAYAVFATITIAVSLVVAVLCYFVYPLIVDRKLSAVQAIKTSARAARANLGGIMSLVLLNAVLGILGTLACCVGAIFLAPVSFATVAVAYRQVFPEDYVESPKVTPEERDYDDQLDLEARPPERREDEL